VRRLCRVVWQLKGINGWADPAEPVEPDAGHLSAPAP
jgi:hypothetical protein